MSKPAEQSELPYRRIGTELNGGTIMLVSNDGGHLIAHVHGWKPEERADRILTACNHFGPLLEACKAVAISTVGDFCEVCNQHICDDGHEADCYVAAIEAAVKAAEANT